MHPFVLLFLCLTVSLFAEQKVVLISGATSGIGLATAKAFQEKGWKVWAGYRQSFPDELKKLKGITPCHLDVTDDNLVQEAVESILKRDGKIDALVNNAGYGLIGAEECITIDEAKQIFDVNFFGALRLTQAVLPSMRQKQAGRIINISSGVGMHALPGLGLYSASKYALEALSETLAATVAHWNIKVSIVEPGQVNNDWGKHALTGTRPCQEEFYKKMTDGIRHMVETPKGQTSEAVAALVVQIADTAQPHVRYQTSSGVKAWIAEKLVDPTGMTDYQENVEFINEVTSQREQPKPEN